MGNYGGAWKREENKPVRLKQKQAVHFLHVNRVPIMIIPVI